MIEPTIKASRSADVAREPAVFLAGNCQLQFLAAVLQAVFPQRVFVVGPPAGGARINFCGLAPNFVTAERARVLAADFSAAGAKIANVFQSTPLGVTWFETGVDRNRVHVVVPHLEMYSLWPERRGLKDVDSKMLSRLYRGDMAAIRSCAAKATVFKDAEAFVDARVRRAPCFHTVNHPRGDLLVRAFDALMREIGGDSLFARTREVAQLLTCHSATDFDSAHPVPQERLDALGLDWGDAYRAWSSGRAALDKGDAKAAVALLNVALREYPSHWQLRSDLGYAYLAAGEKSSGLAFLEWARSANMDNMHLQSKWIYSLLHNGMTPRSVFHRAELARELHPDYLPLFANLAQVCLLDPQIGDAEAYAQKAVDGSPGSDAFASLLARARWAKGKRKEALIGLEEFLDREPASTFSAGLLKDYRIAMQKAGVAAG